MALAAPIRFSVVAGSLPPGLGLDSGGLLSGVPATPGPFTFTIRATGSDGNYVQRAYTMNAGEITPDFLPDGSMSAPYSQTLTANGFSSPTFSIIAGALPSPLTLHPATGVISGSAPTESGLFFFTVQATDGVLTCTKDFTLEVAGVTPQAWWTLDQATGALVESISATPMILDNFGTGATFTSVAGKVGNALQINFTPFDASTATSDPFADLAYQGTGFSMCFWIFFPIGFSGTQTVISYDGGTSGPNNFAFVVDSLDDPLCDGQVTVNGVSNVVNFNAIGAAAIEGIWNFFVFTYNGTTGNVQASINGNALASFAVLGPSSPTPGDPTAGFNILNTTAVAANMIRYDEIGIFASDLDQAGVDFLWNSGAGRTFPF